MPINLGSNKGGFKTDASGKLIPNPSERAGPVPLNSSQNYQGLDQVKSAVSNNIARKNQGASLLRYPLERQNQYPATIIFEPYIVDSYKVSGEGLKNLMDKSTVAKFVRAQTINEGETTSDTARLASVDTSNLAGISTASETINPDYAAELERQKQEDILAQRNAEIDEHQNSMGNKLTDLRAYRDASAPAIALYLPPSLTYADAVNYNSVDLGAGGLTALAGINQRRGIVSSLGRGLSEGVESIFNLARGTLRAEAAQVAASRAANFIPGDKFTGAARIGLQTGLNPGTRVLFQSPSVRNFVFSFKLIATSPQEAEQIEQIVKQFRFQMYPREIDINDIPIGYEFPNVYRISFKFGESGASPHIPRLQYCYLNRVDATYNGQADVFYGDGHPTEVDIQLNFTEYRPLTKRDVEAGF